MINGGNKPYVVYVTGASYIDHSYTIIKTLRKYLRLEVYFVFKTLTDEISNFILSFNAVPVKRRRFRNPLGFFDELNFILALRKLKPDLIWFNTLNIYQIFLVKIFLRNYLITLHDAEIHPESKDKHGRFSTRLLIRFHKAKICTASYSQAEIFKSITGLLPKVLPLPIIDYYYDISPPIENKNKSKGEILRFFFFGSIEKYKGIDQLVEAACLLEEYNDRFEVNIYGKTRYTDARLFQRIKAINSVNLHDKYIDYKKVAEVFMGNDVLILPYKQVTQCGPLLIAYSFDVPVICSDQPGFREYVEDRRSGLIYGNSSTELAEKMKMIIDHPEQLLFMKDYIKTCIYGKFSMESIAQKYINVLTSI